jgi:hypothetical protein
LVVSPSAEDRGSFLKGGEDYIESDVGEINTISFDRKSG